MRVMVGLLFVFTFLKPSFLFACDDNKLWANPPSFEVDGLNLMLMGLLLVIFWVLLHL
jgi:hypothetical protein